MRLVDAELLDGLAQRYVVGTMRGAARSRFAAYMAVRFDILERVRYWEARLAPLAWSLVPVTPSASVWARLALELGFGGRRAPTMRRPWRWQGLAAAFALAAIVAGGGWWQALHRPVQVVTEQVVQRVPEKVSVALVADDDGKAIWISRLRPASRKLEVRVLASPEITAKNDYQLWLLKEDGTPVSLGILPQRGETVLDMDDAALAALDDSQLVAVSLEPPGGSPGPAPSGPVLYTGALFTP